MQRPKEKGQNDKQSIKHYKESEQHKLHKHKGKPRCSRRGSNSRSTSSTHRVMLVKNLMVSH